MSFDTASVPGLASLKLPFSLASIHVYTILTVVAFSALSFVSLVYYGNRKAAKDAKVIPGYPIFGNIQYFTSGSWTFFKRQANRTGRDSFVYKLGKHTIHAFTGTKHMKEFYGNPALYAHDAYLALLGDAPHTPDGVPASQAGRELHARLRPLLKRDNLLKLQPTLIRDVRARMSELEGTTQVDVFNYIESLIFLLSIRLVGCEEVANDRKVLEQTEKRFLAIEESGVGAIAVLLPLLPTPSRIHVLYSSYRMYLTFRNVVDARIKEGRREDDALQRDIDNGYSMRRIIESLFGSLYAAQLNSGKSISWALCHIVHEPKWYHAVMTEIRSVANSYVSDSDISLFDKLEYLPLTAWETEFPILGLCIKESIRIHGNATLFRLNNTGNTIQIGDEVISPGEFATFHTGGNNANSAMYPNPEMWLPERFDENHNQQFNGFGRGRHACMGMKFAYIEQTVTIAHFLAKRKYSIEYADGSNVDRLQGFRLDHMGIKTPEIPYVFKHSPLETRAD